MNTESTRREVGSITLEAVIGMGVLALLFMLLLGVGRYAAATQQMDAAAVSAARGASLARTPEQARIAAADAAQENLAGDEHGCTPQVRVDTSGFTVPVGQAASVSVDVECTVTVLPGVTRTVTGHAVSVLDTYRERGDS